MITDIRRAPRHRKEAEIVKKTMVFASATALAAALTLAAPAMAHSHPQARKTVGRLDTDPPVPAVPGMAYAAPDHVDKSSLNATRRAAYVKDQHEQAVRASRSGPRRLATAVNTAQKALGKPYIWGGTGPRGYDCSGLVQWAYGQAGIRLPRVASAQYSSRPAHPARGQLRLGDLVFYGPTERGIHHVGIYIGSGMMLHAPNSQSKIRFDRVDYMNDYYGATRVG